MSAKECWDTMNPYDRQKNFPFFNPATYGERWNDLEREEKRAVYAFKNMRH